MKMEKDFAVLGKSVVKKDTMEKVLGTARFAADLKMPGMLYGGVLRSTITSGYVKALDASAALAMEGVVCVLTYKDIPGKNRIGIIIKDEPILVDDKIRRYGDAIAVVAAESPDILEDALNAIRVEYEEIEPVLSMERAAQSDSPKVHGDTNVHQVRHLEHGNVDEAFARCDVIIENDYETPALSHMFIEPDAGLAVYENGIMTVYSSTQNPHYDRGEIAAMLNFPNNRVTSVQAATGGGFGGKLDISVQCHAALLAYHTGRPVRIVRSRRESTMVSSKRHAMKMHYKTGATKDGKILAVQATLLSDTGAYASYGPAVITRAAVHAAGPYEIPNVRVDATFYYTNNPMAGAFRGFGVPQVAVAHEGQMNALARALNMDPIEIRLLNAHRPGSVTSTGQVLGDDVSFIQCLEQARAKAREVLPPCIPSAPNKRRGRGYGCMYYGVGNTGLPNPAGAFLEVLPDASVNLMVGCADIGQGSTSAMAQIAAEELGLEYEDIRVTFANTQVTPEGGATSASRQTFISGSATMLAARMAKKTLAEVAAAFLKVPEKDLVFRHREVYSASDPGVRMTYRELMGEMKRLGRLALGCGSYNPKTTGLNPADMSGVPFEVYSYAATIVDLEVDVETGLVDVLNVISAHDVGTAVNRQAVEGQIEGGVVMGTGFALLEKIETKNGRITNPVFSKYLLATSMDAPNIYPIVVEGSGTAGPFGAKGVGEPALIPTIPATADAVEDALHIHFGRLPIQHIDIMRELYRKLHTPTHTAAGKWSRGRAMNCIEKYLAKAAGAAEVMPGQDISCRVSYVAAHDVTAPIAINMFRQIGVKQVFDPDRVILIVDHIYPAASEKARNSVWTMQDFASEFGVHLYHRGEGVIHQLMYEKHRAKPGELIAIADSHTGTCGGYGAIGIGVGSTELAAAMATGRLDLEVPEVVQIYLTGKRPGNVFGKDLILYLGSLFGTDYLVDRALLFTGPGIEDFPVAERMTVCNMGVELGAMITLFGSAAKEPDTAEVREIQLSALEPQIACPFSPANVVPVRKVAGTAVTQVVIGSCTNGRINDMEQVAKAFAGKHVHPNVNTLVIPASKEILNEMEEKGWCRLIRDAGATILNPGCGPCFGAHEGLVSARDTVVATTNRNFPGRMGSMKANIYLASPATAAASALHGVITIPEEEK